MATVYAVASAKGGVGKTTTTAALATILADSGADVVAVDADLGMANLAGAVGVTPGETTLHDVLAGDAEPAAAVREGPSGLRVVPGAADLDAYAAADPSGLRQAIEAFDDADYVFVDAGAGLSHDSTMPLAVADETLLVSTPERSALGDTEKTRQLTERLGGTVAGAAITRVTDDADEVVTALLDAPVLGRVPGDEAVARAAAANQSLLDAAPDAPATRAYRDLARALTGADVDGSDEPDDADEPTDPDDDAVIVDDESDAATDDEGDDRATAGSEDQAEFDGEDPGSDDGDSDEDEEIIVADPDPNGVTKPGDGDDIIVADESEPTETDADVTDDADAGAADAEGRAGGEDDVDDSEPEAADPDEPSDEPGTEPVDDGDDIPDADETAREAGVDRDEGDDRAGAEQTTSGDDVDDELAGSIPFRDDDSGSMNTVLSEGDEAADGEAADGEPADGDEEPTGEPAGEFTDDEAETEEAGKDGGFFSRLFGR